MSSNAKALSSEIMSRQDVKVTDRCQYRWAVYTAHPGERAAS